MTNDRMMTEQRQNLHSGTLPIFTATFAFPVFMFSQKEVPLTVCAFVLFCFSYRPYCQLGPEATMNTKYWAGQCLINVNNMHRENLSDEKSIYIFSSRQAECK